MIKNFEKTEKLLVNRASEFGKGCKKVFVATSGGVDSSLVVAILCRAYGPENVVGLYRNIRSNSKHLKDVKLLQSVFGFKLVCIDGNKMYDDFLNQTKKQFEDLGLPWAEEGTREADELGFTNAYASLKSRLTTPMAGFISKAIDSGYGRVFGTGNGEEDGILRYFDKRGDGAVDNNILNGLTKAEVRQMARYFGVPERIITKLPSADLEARGDGHNDECQLTEWAKKLGFPDLKISYGKPDGSEEGNIAWAWKEDIRRGVITGCNSKVSSRAMKKTFGYSKKETDAILFLRKVEKTTRHKVEPIPGLERSVLIKAGLVDQKD